MRIVERDGVLSAIGGGWLAGIAVEWIAWIVLGVIASIFYKFADAAYAIGLFAGGVAFGYVYLRIRRQRDSVSAVWECESCNFRFVGDSLHPEEVRK